VDAQDTIRQATKYCLFASGIVVVVATLILACTSLPKEIDNRVIYTIVTKPATRLEIVLGKTVGFARTSMVILLIMGVFSYAYLRFNAGQLRETAAARLKSLPASDPSRDTLQHYVDEGLLQSRTYARPTGLAMFAKLPEPSDKYWWLFGNGEQNALYPFDLPAEVFAHPESTFLMFNLHVATKQPRPLNRREMDMDQPDPTATTRPTTRGSQRYPSRPRITAWLLNKEGFTVLSTNQLMDVMHQSDVTSKDPNVFKDTASVLLENVAGSPGEQTAIIAVPPQGVQGRLRELPEGPGGKRRVYLIVTGLTPATLFGFTNDSVTLTSEVVTPAGERISLNIPRATENGRELPPTFRGRLSTTHHQQLRGDADPKEAPVAIFQFRGGAGGNLKAADETVPFEFRTKIERSGAEVSEDENVTNVEMVIRNHKTKYVSPPIMITPDTDRPTFFRAPSAAVAGGDFDVQVRSRTEGHYVGLRNGSIAVVASNQTFAANLFKSLFILWLLSVLVVVISIFCSTFVSWPIAVVLTLVLLLGRWCVVQLGEPSSAQQIWQEFFPKAGSVETRVFTDTYGALNAMLRFVAGLLPDLDQFRVTEDIERGVTIPYKSLLDPLRVLVTFGGPVLLLAYLFLRRKEVAP
jgi:hypothetical protein